MSKSSRTDDGAFNSLRLNKINFHKDAERHHAMFLKDKQERLAAMKACIEADEKRLKAAAKTVSQEQLSNSLVENS